MRPRTKRQRQVFDYIQEFVDSHGHDPSYQQIAVHFNVRSKAGIAKHIVALEEQGLLARKRVNGHFRLELNPTGTLEELVVRVNWLPLPEALANATPDFELVVPALMTGSIQQANLCGFVVQDNAMKDEHVLMGDIALVEKRKFARDRDWVVAAIDSEQLVFSVFRRSGADFEFIPANDNYDRLRFSADRVEILGIFKGLIRPSL